jgi:hypothetical protein
MTHSAVVEHSNIVDDFFPSILSGFVVGKKNRSVLKLPKKLSATAFSQQFSLQFMLLIMPTSSTSFESSHCSIGCHDLNGRLTPLWGCAVNMPSVIIHY